MNKIFPDYKLLFQMQSNITDQLSDSHIDLILDIKLLIVINFAGIFGLLLRNVASDS